MIHEAYMPVYRCPDFHCVVRTGGSTRGSTRGPRGPKNEELLSLLAEFERLLGKGSPKNIQDLGHLPYL